MALHNQTSVAPPNSPRAFARPSWPENHQKCTESSPPPLFGGTGTVEARATDASGRCLRSWTVQTDPKPCFLPFLIRLGCPYPFGAPTTRRNPERPSRSLTRPANTSVWAGRDRLLLSHRRFELAGVLLSWTTPVKSGSQSTLSASARSVLFGVAGVGFGSGPALL